MRANRNLKKTAISSNLFKYLSFWCSSNLGEVLWVQFPLFRSRNNPTAFPLARDLQPALCNFKSLHTTGRARSDTVRQNHRLTFNQKCAHSATERQHCATACLDCGLRPRAEIIGMWRNRERLKEVRGSCPLLMPSLSTLRSRQEKEEPLRGHMTATCFSSTTPSPSEQPGGKRFVGLETLANDVSLEPRHQTPELGHDWRHLPHLLRKVHITLPLASIALIAERQLVVLPFMRGVTSVIFFFGHKASRLTSYNYRSHSRKKSEFD